MVLMGATDEQLFPLHLLAAHEELCQLIDHLPVAIVSWRNQQLHYCNDAFLRLLGRREEQVQQQRDFDTLTNLELPRREGDYRLRYQLRCGWQGS